MYLLKLLKITRPLIHKRSTLLPQILTKQYNDVAFEDIPEVSPALIKRILKSNNVGYEEGYACYIVQCIFCKKNAKSTVNAYINKTTGLYICPHCNKSGDWNYFESHIGNKKLAKRKKGADEGDTNPSDALKTALQDIKSSTKEVKVLSGDDLTLLLEKFKIPVIPSTLVEKLGIRLHNTNNQLFFPLENAESHLVGYRTLSPSHKETIVPTINYGGLLMYRNPKSRDTAILVPNISDFLVLVNSKIGGNIVCLPNGVNNLSQYVLPTLEHFKKLVLWLGNDLKSLDAAKHFSKKLGEKRCQFIRPSDKNQLPHLVNEEDIKNIVNSAQPVFHKSITTFAGLRAEVLSDLQNIDKVQGVKWKRYPTLNKILKGHRRGELTVITGPTGSGKTTFISEYSLDLAMQGVNTLWGSFEIRNARLARTMLQQMAGIPLDENLHLFEHWADEFEKLPVYYMTFHGQQSIKVVMEAVEHATYVHDIAHVIIDNVQFMMGMGEEQRHMDRFWKQDAIIDAFRTFATRKNCHVSLVIHPRKEKEDEDLTTSSIFGGAKASQEADNVLIIQDKRLTSVRGKKYLQVAKNRYSGDLGIMALDFDKASLSYAKKPKKPSDEKPKDTITIDTTM